MRNRNIPFGYQYQNGVLAVHPQESQTVRAVFAAYLSGEPLSKIAANLTAKLVEYLPGHSQWDKARVKRLLDNVKYTGEGDFPQLITEKQFQMAHQKKESANTNRQLADEDIKLFKGLTHCHHCGGIMMRRMDSRFQGTAYPYQCVRSHSLFSPKLRLQYYRQLPRSEPYHVYSFQSPQYIPVIPDSLG